MDVAALLVTLGVNKTIYFQFGIFVITFVTLYYVLFKPYFMAYHERVQRTEGNQQASERLLVEADELKTKYEAKAKEINATFKSVYDESRTQALHEYDEITSKARSKAKGMLDENKVKIQAEFKSAKEQIKSEVDGISQSVVSKILS